MKRSLIVLTLTAILLAACNGAAGGTTGKAQTSAGIDGIEIIEVVFAKSLSDKIEAVDVTTTFDPSD